MAELSASMERKIQSKLEEALEQDLSEDELQRLDQKITTIRKLAAS